MTHSSIHIGNITLTAQCEEKFTEILTAIMEHLKEIDPNELEDGYPIQVGFNVFHLIETDEKFTLVAPDYQKDPLTDVTEDLSFALDIFQQQLVFQQSLGIDGEDLAFHHGILVVEGVFQEEKICIQRDQAETPVDSGWLIFPEEGEINEDKIQIIQAFELLKRYPAMVKVLTLPVDYSAVFVRGNLVAVYNEEEENLLRK